MRLSQGQLGQNHNTGCLEEISHIQLIRDVNLKWRLKIVTWLGSLRAKVNAEKDMLDFLGFFFSLLWISITRMSQLHEIHSVFKVLSQW